MDRSEAIYQNILRLFCKARTLLGAGLWREREREGQVVSDKDWTMQ